MPAQKSFRACWLGFGILSLAGVVAGGCAARGGSNDVGGRTEIITAEEIAAASAASPNAHELVRRLRPRWLQPHARISINTPSAIVVYQDDLNLGGPEALERIPTEIVLSVRLLSAAQAGTLPGIGSMHVDHAIVVQTRREPRRP
ncbi:MAG TPA: hypothetical protein VK864_04045 [Longimicrobiales bacterium]|nr:hypothetical protein [Longimicrobiales bacterium]